MRLGQSLYRDDVTHPVHFMPIQSQYMQPEIFRPITSDVVPGVKPYYMISNYGRIWHVYKHIFLSVNIDTKGYLFKTLSTIYGPVICRIHRLVMQVFNPIENSNNMLVNHIDGNKANPYIGNLEWCTCSENVIHANNTGLRGNVDKISESKVKEICVLLEDRGKTLTSIAEEAGVSYTTVQAIQQKRAYINISVSYDIQSRKINNNLSIDQIHKICDYFEKHPQPIGTNQFKHAENALKSIGVSNPLPTEIRSAKKVLAKETYQYISKDYMF